MLPVMNPNGSRSNCRASGMLDQDEDLFLGREGKVLGAFIIAPENFT